MQTEKMDNQEIIPKSNMWYDHSVVFELCKKLKKKEEKPHASIKTFTIIHSFSNLMVGRISFCKSFNLFKVTTNYSKVTAIHLAFFKQK